MDRRISTVIPVRNNAADLPDAVASVIDQPSVVEVLLCVGPSEDGSIEVAADLAERHRQVRVIENQHGGIPQALNLGLAAAVGDLLLRLDAHSVLPGDYVGHALQTAADTNAANVGAVQFPVGVTVTERAIAAAMSGRAGSGGASYRHGGGAPMRVDTAFLGLFEVDVLRSIGGWDEGFARNEDAELNARLWEAGHEVWLDPRLVVEYRPRSSLRALARQYFDYGPGRFRTIRKHPRTLRIRQLAAPVIVVAVVASLLLGLLVTPWAFALGGAYLAAVLVAGLLSAGPLHQRLLTGAALATMHVSWGTGFLLAAARSLLPGG